jgi:Laminin G domain
VQDFMSLEVSEGYAKLLIDYGSGTSKLEQKQVKLSDGHRHHVDIKWNTDVSCIIFCMQLVQMNNWFCHRTSR